MKLDRSKLATGMPGICSAAVWNEFAKKVNQLWNTRAASGVTLTKGTPWLYQSAGTGGGGLEFNGPIWHIYVMRNGAATDWQIEEEPSAVYLTGPFTAVGGTTAKRIAKLVSSAGATAVDAAFSSSCGFNMTSGQDYYRQLICKYYYNGDPTLDFLIVSAGAYIEDNDGTPGMFFGIDQLTGETRHNGFVPCAPFANIEALLPGINQETVMGVACYGDTIALATGFLGTHQVGITLYDTNGIPTIADIGTGSYLWDTGSASGTVWCLSASNDGYLYSSDNPFTSKTRKVDASILSGIVPNAAWDANAGTGGLILDAASWNRDLTRIGMALGVGNDWNGNAVTTPASEVGNDGSGYYEFAGVMPPSYAQFLGYGGTSDLVGGNQQEWIMMVEDAGSGGDNSHLWIVGIYTLTGGLISGFNGQVVDCKFFRRMNDGVTDQFIVVGEFTTYQGEPAPYMVFIDQDGNRLADLEWP